MREEDAFPHIGPITHTEIDLQVIEQQLCEVGDALLRDYRLLRDERYVQAEDLTVLEDGMDNLLAIERSLGFIPQGIPIKERASAVLGYTVIPDMKGGGKA